MTKKEILKIINANLTIINNDKIMNIGKIRNFELSEEKWFPEIEELKSDFEILKQEVKERREAVKKSKRYLKEMTTSIKCNHSVRLTYPNIFGRCSQCIFCDKYISGDNTIDGRIYKNINKNRNCVMLNGEYIDEDGDYYSGYTKKQVYEIIMKILEKRDDDEEIDLISEIEKLNLKDCKIDRRPFEEEYYVLIIGGTNKYYISENQYITSDRIFSSIDFAYFLCGIPKVNVLVLENKDIYENQIYKDKFSNIRMSNVCFTVYNSNEELKQIIKYEKTVPFNIIINTSSLFEYKIEDDKITYQKIDLKLKEIFPKSHIVNVTSIKEQKNLLEIIRESLMKQQEDCNTNFIFNENKFYYLSDELVKGIDINTTCNKIKKLLLKKEE